MQTRDFTDLSPRQVLVAMAVLIVLVLAAVRTINGSPVTRDAAQNLQMGIDLAHHGTMSLDEAPPFKPSMYREPLPAAVNALAVRLLDARYGTVDASGYFTGPRARAIKLQNAFWVVLLWITVFAAVRRFTRSYLLALVGAVLAVKPFFPGVAGIDSLYTELPAAALMTLSLDLLLATEIRGNAWLAAACGVSFGLLTLTKAATLYVFVALVGFLALGCALGWLWADGRRRLAHLAVLVASFGFVVAPWMLRNLHWFGHAELSSRGGLVLYTRGLLDEVTPLEYRGSFYVWARPSVQRYLGRLLGFSPQDLEIGGRLQRLSEDPQASVYRHDLAAEAAGRPQDAISFHRQARAERVRLETLYDRAHDSHPDVDADETMKHDGMQLVRQHPGANLAMSVALMWRSAPMIFPVLLVALVYAWRVQRFTLALFVFPGFATLVFYALATHFEPRPSLVTHSTAVVAVVVLVQSLWRWWYTPAQPSPVARRAFCEYHQVREGEIPGE